MDTAEIQRRVFDFWEIQRSVPQTARQLTIGLVNEAAEAALLFRFTDEPDPHKLALESLDAVIASLGVLRALGVDIEPLFEEKMADIERRYPLAEFTDCAADYERLHG